MSQYDLVQPGQPVDIRGVGSSPVAGGLSSLLGSPVLGGVVSGGLGILGGMLGNRSSAKAARQQQQWQEHMRATQYQTAVSDLKAAGLNPMLAYTQGGAGTPSGGMAQQRDVISPAMASAASVASAMSNIANVMADTENKKAQADNINADTEVKRKLARLTTHQGTSAYFTAKKDEENYPHLLQQLKATSLLEQLKIPEAKAYADLYSAGGSMLSGAKSLVDLLPIFKFLLSKGGK